MKHRNSFPLTIVCWAQRMIGIVKIADLFVILPTCYIPPWEWANKSWNCNGGLKNGLKTVERPFRWAVWIIWQLIRRWRQVVKMTLAIQKIPGACLTACAWIFFLILVHRSLPTTSISGTTASHLCSSDEVGVVGKRATKPLDSFPGREWNRVT